MGRTVKTASHPQPIATRCDACGGQNTMSLPFASNPDRKSLPLAAALRAGVLFGAAVLLSPAFAASPHEAGDKPHAGPAKPATTQSSKKVVVTHEAAKKPSVAKPTAGKTAPTKPAVAKAAKRKDATAKATQDQRPGQLANFGKASPSADVVHVANWVSYTRNNKKSAFVLIDKKQARMYVFDPQGKLKSDSPILLGKAIGDQSVPGIGDKPISQIREDEKTTPAGRFAAVPGKNTGGDDIIWIDYNASVSMHRMRKVSAKEHRAERMATADPGDNRISYGCVNVPAKFYDAVLKPTVVKQGAIIYVLPETTTPQQLFGSVDVTPNVAKAGAASKAS
jgi:lipoprotein-anchoring transpeptidase ErfK/SrfK